jgi:hypothetical protein
MSHMEGIGPQKNPIEKTLTFIDQVLKRPITTEEAYWAARQFRADLDPTGERKNLLAKQLFDKETTTKILNVIYSTGLEMEQQRELIRHFETISSDIASSKKNETENNVTGKENRVLPEKFTLDDVPAYMWGYMDGWTKIAVESPAAKKLAFSDGRDIRNNYSEETIHDALHDKKPLDTEIVEVNGQKILHIILPMMTAGRGSSILKMSIKIPEGVDAAPFKEDIAQDVMNQSFLISDKPNPDPVMDNTALNIVGRNSQYQVEVQGQLQQYAQERLLEYINNATQ